MASGFRGILLMLAAVGLSGCDSICGPRDSEQAVLTDCDRSGLTPRAIDKCVERARALERANPSVQLEQLLAMLAAPDSFNPSRSRGTRLAYESPQSDEMDGAGSDAGNDDVPPVDPAFGEGLDSDDLDSDQAPGADDLDPDQTLGPDDAVPLGPADAGDSDGPPPRHG
jgi:hypothetical protein